MDFDELDEVAPVAVNNQVPKGDVLPPIKRTRRCPSDDMLPDRLRKRCPPHIERQPQLRVLITMGAADSIAQEWMYLAHEAPLDIEVIVHEPPGHGTRDDEEVSTTLEQMGDDAFEAFREAMDTGSFVLLGHSIGCLTAVYVAERAKRELNVEPLLAVMVERGAAHIPAFSEFGYDLLKDDPYRFMQIRDPSTAKGCNPELGDFGKQALRMWGSDLLLENDIRPVGWHTFSCPLHCYRCRVFHFKDCKEEDLKSWEDNIKIHNQEKDYVGHFGPKEFEEWNKWTDHPDGATTTLIENSNHMTIKAVEDFKKPLWATLKDIIAKF